MLRALSPTKKQQVNSGSGSGSGSKGSGSSEEEENFFTPEEEPKYSRRSEPIPPLMMVSPQPERISEAKEQASSDSDTLPRSPSPPSSNPPVPPVPPRSMRKIPSSAGFTIPNNLFRLSMFLVQEKANVLLKLMSAVSLRTINHENICCLNTTLLVLMFEQKRGVLGNMLSKIRDLAKANDDKVQEAKNKQAERKEAVGSAFYKSSSSAHTSMNSFYLSSAHNSIFDLSSMGDLSAEAYLSPSSAHTGNSIADQEAHQNSSALYCTVCDFVAPFTGEYDDDMVFDLTCTECGKGNLEVLHSTEEKTQADDCLSPLYGTGIVDTEIPLRRTRSSASLDRPSHSTGGGGGEGEGGLPKQSSPRSLRKTVRSQSSSSLFGKHREGTPAKAPSKNTVDSGTNQVGERVMKNFRELLWYWQEYYLRRGRDRLSIEFSSHIPFTHWNSLVELLCKDDGAATSLLSRPVKLPTSPYSPRPFLKSNFVRTAENCIINRGF